MLRWQHVYGLQKNTNSHENNALWRCASSSSKYVLFPFVHHCWRGGAHRPRRRRRGGNRRSRRRHPHRCGVVGFWVPVVPLSCAVTNAPSALDPDPAAPSLVVAPSYISGRWNNLQLLEEPTNINSSFPCPCFANVTNHNALAHVAPKLIQANKTILLLNEIKNGQRRHRGVKSNKV